MTYSEYKAAFSKLSERQKEWVKLKAKWEGCSLWAVLEDWTPPPSRELTARGTARDSVTRGG